MKCLTTWQSIRVFFLLAPGIIHPDEYMQSIDPLCNYLLGSNLQLPWEYSSIARSLGPNIIIFGPFLLFYHFLQLENEFLLFLGIKVTLLFWSFFLDKFINRFCAKNASTHSAGFICLTYSTRSFSNTIELYVLLASILSANPFVLGMLTSVGIFNRITYPAFVLPYLLDLLFTNKQIQFWIYFAISGGLFTILLIFIDSILYNYGSITPLRFPLIQNLLYNINTENLKLHGLHSRWTHVFVNIPLIYLPYVTNMLQAARNSMKYATYLIFPILLLSLFPHQEARFLVAMFPLILYTTGNFSIKYRVVILHGLLLSFIFYFHQGGMIHLLFTSPLLATASTNSSLWLYKTYSMPEFMTRHKSFNVNSIGSNIGLLTMKSGDYIAMPSNVACPCWTNYYCNFEGKRLEYVSKHPHLSLDSGIDFILCMYQVK
eukprot:NODE_21_length_42443_cov_0.822808.p8 type:complete len:431 gc:universal NODE_21_length_42443_cov_0.822808:26430-25138(-)